MSYYAETKSNDVEAWPEGATCEDKATPLTPCLLQADRIQAHATDITSLSTLSARASSLYLKTRDAEADVHSSLDTTRPRRVPNMKFKVDTQGPSKHVASDDGAEGFVNLGDRGVVSDSHNLKSADVRTVYKSLTHVSVSIVVDTKDWTSCSSGLSHQCVNVG
jgi:hypothetical protein